MGKITKKEENKEKVEEDDDRGKAIPEIGARQ